MRKSLSSTTSIACAHHGWVATERRNAEGIVRSIKRPENDEKKQEADAHGECESGDLHDTSSRGFGGAGCRLRGWSRGRLCARAGRNADRAESEFTGRFIRRFERWVQR